MVSLGYAVRMNELDDTIEVNGEKLSDGLEAQILMRMADVGLSRSEWVKRAYTATAHQNRYHPVKEFLNSLVWDGTDWIAEFERYVWDKHPKIIYADGRVLPVFGAWLKRWGVGAVAKVLRTGLVRGQNTVLTLSGAQNLGKSTLARSLCPMGDEFFIESHIDPDDSNHIRYLATRLCWEVAELGATTRKSDRESLKSFLTRQDVTFRPPYAHHPVTKPALTSFIGTINPENGFLNDPTGNRRFLPVELTRIDFGYQQAIDRRQLWAQFVALYHAGESATLTPEETAMADAIRNENETEDTYTGFIQKYYEVDPENQTWTTTTTDIVDQLTINGVTGANISNIGMSLKRLGLERKRSRLNGLQETRWIGIIRNKFGDMVRR
jgi:predicted P-loop ATPase